MIAETADRVAVMYAGRIVEQGTVRDIFHDPKHPYTRGLLASIPGGSAGSRLKAIDGTVPSLANLPPGCSFAPRCPRAHADLRHGVPAGDARLALNIPCDATCYSGSTCSPEHSVRGYLRTRGADR